MKRLSPLIGLLALALILSSCAPQDEAGEPTATSTGMASPTATSSSTATATPTPTETQTPTPMPSPTALAYLPCDQAAFVEDVTVPDGTQMSPDEQFTKTWRLENTGTCTWTPAYLVVFDSGDLLDAPASSNMPGYVAPGQTVDISVSMTAPNADGVYEGFWSLEDSSGTRFALGPDADPFDVQIAVGQAQAAFEVRNVFLSVDNTSVTAACPPGFTFTITANIRTNGSGQVVYRWEFSDGRRSRDMSFQTDQRRHNTVSITFEARHSGVYSATLQILDPNNANFGSIQFSLNCTGAPPSRTPFPEGFTPRPRGTPRADFTPHPPLPPPGTPPAPGSTPTPTPTADVGPEVATPTP
jgi:hypothetical protein